MTLKTTGITALVHEVLRAEEERVRAICEQDWPALDAVLTDNSLISHGWAENQLGMPGSLDWG